MEPNLSCSICKNELSSYPLVYSCGHKFCLSCFPYIMYNIITSTGIESDFFYENKNSYPCMICHNGTSDISIRQLIESLKMEDKTIFSPDEKNGLCDACIKNISTLWCKNCNFNYCSKCEKQFHGKHKGFQKHIRVTLMEKQEKERIENNIFKQQCKCFSKNLLEYFCLDCKMSICRYCLKCDHEIHASTPLKNIFDSMKAINYENGKSHLKDIYKQFLKFKNDLLLSIKTKIENDNKEFIDRILEIIDFLDKLKKKNFEKNEKFYKIIEKKFSFIETSLLLFDRELDDI